MSWWKWLETQSSLPLPPPWIYIYIIYIICFLKYIVFYKHLSRNIKWILAFTKCLCSTFLARSCRIYSLYWGFTNIYIYILETVTSKHQVPFLPSTSPNNCEFDSSNKTLAPNKKSEMSHFLHTMPLYILSLVLASNIMIVARHYIWMLTMPMPIL